VDIDFHHAVTYVLARIAGFTHDDAAKVAYSAQYVDDAINDGTICFDNKAMYTRINSAHKTVDPENLSEVKNHLIWLPFHFLPGNGGTEEKGAVGDHFINKIVCLRGIKNPVACDMLEMTLAVKDKPNGLHRLGITMHVYADTWAHQGFAGVLNDINEVDDPKETGDSGVFAGDLGTELVSWLAEKIVPPLGHGRAQGFPDMPFLSWQYTNGKNETIVRNNTDLFCEAADAMCQFMGRFNSGTETKLNEKDATEIRRLFTELKEKDSNKRHQAWVAAIKEGKFSFGPADISYDDKDKNSWKAKALGTAFDLPVHNYRDDFLNSDWKMYHDALQQHRLVILHDVLPKYGICAG
jgi:hypothetical protein